MTGTFGILVHGGAGTERITRFSEIEFKLSRALEESARIGYDTIAKRGQDAVTAVELAVVHMENSGLFCAGIKGSCLTLDKKIEMDASIMEGKNLNAGSIGIVHNINNPIKLARLVMEKTDHVMLAGIGAEKLARHFGLESPNRQRLDKQRISTYNKLIKQMGTRWEKNYQLVSHFGTVGAVAMDRRKNVAAAVSTGGRWLKMSGRIGDSAIIGAGIYANNRLGAACCTGKGELMIRLCLSKCACDYMKTDNAFQASTKAIQILTDQFGSNSGGMITIDRKGRFGAATNTRVMPISVHYYNNRSKADKTRVAITKEEVEDLFSQ
jgi:beta-aspartyl-peptidase (threonine type)